MKDGDDLVRSAQGAACTQDRTALEPMTNTGRCEVLPYEGEVVGAFRILKHFDIAQPYNAATGEKLNILVKTPSIALNGAVHACRLVA